MTPAFAASTWNARPKSRIVGQCEVAQQSSGLTSAFQPGDFAERPSLPFVCLTNISESRQFSLFRTVSVHPIRASARSMSRPCMRSVTPARCDTASQSGAGSVARPAWRWWHGARPNNLPIARQLSPGAMRLRASACWWSVSLGFRPNRTPFDLATYVHRRDG
jgi:hypothetical protein